MTKTWLQSHEVIQLCFRSAEYQIHIFIAGTLSTITKLTLLWRTVQSQARDGVYIIIKMIIIHNICGLDELIHTQVYSEQ